MTETEFEPPSSPPAAMAEGDKFLPGEEALPPAAAIAQLLPRAASLSRRQRARRGVLAKADAAYSSVQALEVIAHLLRDTRCYLEEVARREEKERMQLRKLAKSIFRVTDGLASRRRRDKAAGAGAGADKAGDGNDDDDDDGNDLECSDWISSMDLPRKCLLEAIDGLDEQISIISMAIANTAESKDMLQAAKKLSKTQRRITHEAHMKNSMAMKRDPESALTSSLSFAKGSLEDMLAQTNADFIDPARRASRKRKPPQPSDADGMAEEAGPDKKLRASDEENLEFIEVIEMPSLMEGSGVYSPLETVAYISNIIACKPGRSYINAYKEEMIAQKLVPVQKSQLNAIVAQYGGSTRPLAPLHWNEKKIHRDFAWDSLLVGYHDSQTRGLPWSIEDTRKTLHAAAKEKGMSVPGEPSIEVRHTALVTLHQTQNHISEQIRIQEQRLKEMPPSAAPRKAHGYSTKRKHDRFERSNEKYDGIFLPEPTGGELVYTPSETVLNITNFMNRDPPPSRTEVRLYKEKIIAEGFIPISITQLNELLKKHGGPGKDPAPESWNRRGRREIISLEDLIEKVKSSQVEYWTVDHTREIVWAAKRKLALAKHGADPEEVKPPNPKSVTVYHTSLLNVPEISHKIAKLEKPKPRSGPNQ